MKLRLMVSVFCSSIEGGLHRSFAFDVEQPILNLDEVPKIVKEKVFIDPNGIAERFFDYYGININFIRAKTRKEHVRKKRQELSYFLYKYSLLSDTQIGDVLGVDRGTVLHGVGVVENDMQVSKAYAHDIDQIRKHIGLCKALKDVGAIKKSKYVRGRK